MGGTSTGPTRSVGSDDATLPADGVLTAGEAPMTRSLDPDAPPRRLGPFTVLGTLGHGAMGIVLEARDERLDRSIALKVLHRDTTARHADRLEREAKALARLSHPNVVQVYEVGEADGRMFIAMELVRGRTLRRWQDERPSWRECVEVYLQAGRGLVAAHAVGLAHRDFKPHNCIIDDEGRVRVLDFGLARELDVGELGARWPEQEPGEDSQRVDALTRTGAVLGTLAYMPLEQLRGEAADERSDQFSFCVALYEAVYGERPYAGDTMGTLTHSLDAGLVCPAPAGSRVPQRLRRVLLRGLAREPGERWPSMEPLLEALARIGRRRSAWAVLAVGGATVAVTAAVSSGTAEPPCRGAAAQLAEVWNDEVREQLHAAMLATEVSYADGTWQRVEPVLDAYARSWVDAHTDACEATAVRREQSAEVMDLRMACLATRRIALRQTIEVLHEVDETVVEGAATMVSQLPGVGRCEDIESLRAAVPPPDDPGMAGEVEALREQIAHADTLILAGSAKAALAEAEAVLPKAEAVGYAPLVAEALRSRGEARELAGHYETARDDLERAYLLAVEQQHDAVATEATLALSYVEGKHLQQPKTAMVRARTALALSQRPHANPRSKGWALHEIGSLLLMERDNDEGIAYLERALELHRAQFSPNHPEVARTLNNIGMALVDGGHFDQALAYVHEALEMKQASLGPEHPDVASTWSNVSVVEAQRGRWSEAAEAQEHALAILEPALGSEHPRVATTLTNLGGIRWKQGDLQAAQRDLERALAANEVTLGPDHLQVAQTLTNLGGLMRTMGKPDEAVRRLKRALEIFEATVGPEHPSLAIPLASLGTVYELRNEHQAALECHRRALAIRREVFGTDHPSLASSLNSVGKVLRLLGRLDEAEPLLREALDAYERAMGPDALRVADPLYELAAVALARGERDDARALAERVLGIRAQDTTEFGPRAHGLFLLARILDGDSGQSTRARTLAEHALSDYQAVGERYADEAASVEQWLEEHPEPG